MEKMLCSCVHGTGGHSRWSSFPPTRQTLQLFWRSRGWRCQSNLLMTWQIRQISSMGLFKEEVLWPSSWYVGPCLCKHVFVWNCVCVCAFHVCTCDVIMHHFLFMAVTGLVTHIQAHAESVLAELHRKLQISTNWNALHSQSSIQAPPFACIAIY